MNKKRQALCLYPNRDLLLALDDLKRHRIVTNPSVSFEVAAFQTLWRILSTGDAVWSSEEPFIHGLSDANFSFLGRRSCHSRLYSVVRNKRVRCHCVCASLVLCCCACASLSLRSISFISAKSASSFSSHLCLIASRSGICGGEEEEGGLEPIGAVADGRF